MDTAQPTTPQLTAEHHRLVRLCARLTGDHDAADDLAQETLAEAWRLRDRLRDESARAPWLAAIARNLCLRWLRQRGRERARIHLASVGVEDTAADPWDHLADPADFTIELERHELAELLDRALAALPPATAQVLIACYIHESPYGEIAARLGISADAVAMRLARGKLKLRRLLDGDLRDAAAPYGPAAPVADGWQETRIWCPRCAQRRLHGRFERPGGLFAFRCPGCQPAPADLLTAFRLGNPHFARLLSGVSRFKPAYARTLAWLHDYYRRGLAEGHVPCTNCGAPTPLHRATGASAEAPSGPWPRLALRCAACGEPGSTALGGLVHALPRVRQFWREHPRMRLLPPQELVSAGRPALVVRVTSATDGAYLDVLSDRDTFAVLAIHGNTAAAATPDAL